MNEFVGYNRYEYYRKIYALKVSFDSESGGYKHDYVAELFDCTNW